ncbi:MAG: hypothetical protein QM775_22255 [Pirellulales bacterium]
MRPSRRKGYWGSWLRRFDRHYEQAELPIERNRYLAFACGLSAAVGSIVAWRPGPIWIGPIVAAVGLCMAGCYIALRRKTA